MENRIKDHKLDTKSDRMLCYRRQASQFGLFLHTDAHWLLHRECHAAPQRSSWQTVTFETSRSTFLKLKRT